MSNKLVLLDVDGVVADFATPFHKLAERVCERALPPPSKWDNWYAEGAMNLTPLEIEHVHAAARRPDWPQQIGLYPDAPFGVKELARLNRVVFVTAPWEHQPTWTYHRTRLLEKYFPGFEVVHTSAKYLVRGDFLVDDRGATIEQGPMRGAEWEGLLWAQPWNRNANVHCWEDVLEKVSK